MPKFNWTPPLDVANVASKLPEPLRQAGGFIGQLATDALGINDPNAVMMTPAALKMIHPDELYSVLSSPQTRHYVEQSPYLKQMLDLDHAQITGSSIIAKLASGLGRDKMTVRNTDLNALGKLTASEAREAAKDVTSVTQRVLSDLGVDEGDTVKAFRFGAIPEKPYWLTPTSLNETFQWGGGPKTEFHVPRTDIKALPGIVHRGDEITANEALIPAGKLIQSIVGGNVVRSVPRIHGTPVDVGYDVNDIPGMLRELLGTQKYQADPNYAFELRKIPSWFKKENR